MLRILQTGFTMTQSTDSHQTAVMPTADLAPASWSQQVLPYFQIARPDHWFKNVFMLVGVVLAIFYFYDLAAFSWIALAIGLASTCLVASSNYVINEILDAPTDRDHPVKCQRPIPAGLVNLPLAYAEWLFLAAVGLGLAALVNTAFLATAAALWVMGLIYNIPPIRSKELPYIDVISESVNNPLRLMLGWFVVNPLAIPPLSLMISYWMVGAFFMASKRFAEYRSINDPIAAAAYRKSFRYYDDNRLLVSMFFYGSAAALLLGVFIVRYKLELLLAVPIIAGFFAMYLQVTLKPNSPVQNPERLYRERVLMAYLTICVMAFLGLMFVDIPGLYDVFNVTPSQMKSLWKF
jgi:decaprenyl-phosphate phosphoribosyltransferase